MKKKIVFLFLLLCLICIKVEAGFPNQLKSLINPAYCNKSGCYQNVYLGDQLNTPIFKIASCQDTNCDTNGTSYINESNSNAIQGRYDLSLNGNTYNRNSVAILCTNFRKSSDTLDIEYCNVITDTSMVGYWDDATQAGVASIVQRVINHANTNTATNKRWPKVFASYDSNGSQIYSKAMATITRFERAVGVNGFSTNDTFACNNTNGNYCPDDWYNEAKRRYDIVNDIENLSIGSVTSTEDNDAFYLTIPVSGASGSTITVSLSSSAEKLSDGRYKILKSNLSQGSNTITITATASYTTTIAKNFMCYNSSGQAMTSSQTYTPIYLEEKPFENTVTKDISITNNKYYKLDVNGCLDGKANSEGLHYSLDGAMIPYGSFDAKINNSTPPSGSYSAGNKMDFYASKLLANTQYEFSNISARYGYTYLGYSYGYNCDVQSTDTNISGMLNNDVVISLVFASNRTYTITKQKTNGDPIAGAVFKIYNEPTCDDKKENNVVDTVTTALQPLKVGQTSKAKAILSLPQGTYYFKEILAGSSDYYFNSDEAECRDLDLDESKNIVENKTWCEGSFASDSSVLNRIKIYNDHTMSNDGKFNKLLDFTISDATQACNSYSAKYKNNNNCMYSHKNISFYDKKDSKKTPLTFSESDLSAYNDVVRYTGDIIEADGKITHCGSEGCEVGYCLTEFYTQNYWTMPTESVKTGTIIIGSNNIGTRALEGVLKKTCYVYKNITSSFNDLSTYNDYVSSIKINGISLYQNKNETELPIKMEYMGTKENGLKKFVNENSLGDITTRVTYEFNDVYAYKISGRPCPVEEVISGRCAFIGSGIFSQFKDGNNPTNEHKEIWSNFSFDIDFTDIKNENPTANNELMFFEESNYCTYKVSPEIIKYPDDSGKIELEFRTIDTNKPFERTPKSNWNIGNNVNDYIVNATNSYGIKNGETKLQTPIYKIILTPDTITKIREYNAGIPYDNYEVCQNDGDNTCESENKFLDKYIKDGIIKRN